MNRILVAVLVLAAGVAAIGQSKTTRELSYKEALEQAQKNSKTSDGATYDAAVSTYFGQHYGPIMDKCTSGPSPDLRTFEIVFRVAADGAASHIMVWPETKVATCVRKNLAGAVFLKPPQRDYWAHIHMELRAE